MNIVSLIFSLLIYTYAESSPHPILTEEFQQELDGISHSKLLSQNQLELLIDAAPSLSKKIEIVQSADHSIFISAMIYFQHFNPDIQKFNSILMEKAKGGIPVFIIIDKMNSYLDPFMFNQLTQAGVHIAYFNSVWGPDTIPMSVRCHEKVVIVDGERAVIGGQNLYDERYQWLQRLSPFHHYGTMIWRDTDLYVEGPLVFEMASHYVDFWKTIRSDVIPALPEIRDSVAPQDDVGLARFIYNEPYQGHKYISQTYLKLIEMAQHEIIWQANQVVLPKEFQDALIAAANRGVNVILMTNSEKTSWWQPFWYNYNVIKGYFPFNHTKVKLMLYQNRYNHTKVFYVDGDVVSVGSLNHDYFSLENDAESTVMIYDPLFIQMVHDQALIDLKDTHPFSFPF